MKTNIKLLLKVVLVCTLKQLNATDIVGEVSQQLLCAGAKEVKNTMHEAMQEAGALQQSTDEDIAGLSYERVISLQNRTVAIRQDKIPLRHNCVKTSLALAQDTYVQAEKLRRNTVMAIERIIQQAEEKAFRIKSAKRHKIMTAFLAASKHREKKAWKQGLHDEYLEQMQALEDIIRQGESAQEYQDFAVSFDRQRAWFASTLEKIKTSSVESYSALFYKVQMLKNIMISFNQVAGMLDQRISKANMTIADIDKARLLALYDIQALVVDKSQHDSVADESYLSKRECGLVVEGIFNKLAARSRIDELMTQKATMQSELLSQQNRVQLLDELVSREQQELVSIVERVRNEQLPPESQPKQIEAVQLTPVAPITAAENNAIPHDTALAAIEKINKENAELQIKILEDESTIARLKAPVLVNPLAVTSTVPQSVSVQQQAVHPITPGVAVRSSVEVAEKQIRATLEGELQQRMAHG